MRLRLTVLSLAVAVLAGCGGGDPPAPAPAASSSSAAATPAATPASAASSAAAAAEEKVLTVLNWSDYIAEDTIANFEKETGIKVTYDVFDSNEVLEAKLMTGNSGYDVVVPSLHFLGRQIQAGVFMPLDKSKLSNYGNLDPQLNALIAKNDPDNTYSVNYLWGTTGIGYNEAKLKERFPDGAPINDWKMVFDPAFISKMTDCGVYVLDSPAEMMPLVQLYNGDDPNSFDPAVIQKAADVLMKIRPHITQFHSSEVINALANGDACLAVAWSGDILQAAARAEEADKGVKVGYSIPQQGTAMWFDMLAIPKDAQRPNNAHLFINYLLRPEVMAGISNYVSYASANAKATPLIDEKVRGDERVFLKPEVLSKLFVQAVIPPEVDRIYNRTWTALKTSQ